MGKVVSLRTRAPGAALEHLNRLTGLTFDRLPESLVSRQDHPRVAPARQERR